MIPEEVLLIVTQKIEAENIPYVIVGSMASNIYSAPRLTYDADIIIETERPALERFMDSFGEDFYADKLMAINTFSYRGMFNLIHMPTGFKIDIIFKKHSPFNTIKFNRRCLATLMNTQCWFLTPEDVILSKLEWSKMSESERQFNDAIAVARTQNARLDRAYLKTWAKEIGVQDLLDKVLDHVDHPN